MVNKKYLLLAGLCSVMAAQPVFAQESAAGAKWSSRDMTYRGQNYDVLDSNYIHGKNRMERQRRYYNHQEIFPARPSSMWEVGVGGGMFNVLGDVSHRFGYGFHGHVRKAFGYMMSGRLQYIYGVARGVDDRLTVASDPAWTGLTNGFNYNTAGPNGTVYSSVGRNFRTEMHSLNFDFMFNFRNINFHRARITANPYAFVGIGVRSYNVHVNALNDETFGFGPNSGYNFDSLAIGQDRDGIKTAIKDNLDDTYETSAFDSSTLSSRGRDGDENMIGFAPSIGAGIAFRLSPRINIQVEDRYSFGVGDDWLDGHRFTGGAPTTGWDGVNYLSLGVNFNIGNRAKRVEPLYWMNPLDHVYSELSYPRHMMLPDPVLPDADGDGVTDQFDKCPGTPAGVAVDTHGCPMDTDGDGVPDDRDKELITPTYCQPVDADGVGKCPCPEGCGTASACANIGAGSITFDNNSSRIGSGAQAQLATLAAQMQANPTCKVVVVGSGAGSKIQQQRSWDRVNAIIEYMSEKHSIDRNRFIFQYGQAGDANSVMYRSAMTGEEGPANVAPPFPNLRRD